MKTTEIIETVRDGVVFCVAMYGLFWLICLTCVGAYGTKACGF